MAQLIKMFQSQSPPGFVVHHDGVHALSWNPPANRGRRHFTLVQIREHMDVYKKPVGYHDQRIHMPFQEHPEVALESVMLVVCISENRKIAERVKSVLDPAQDGRTKRIRHIE